MGLLNDIEPLKQAALAELKSAPDLAALEQSKGAWIGPHGKVTALMKQLGTLSKEEKPAAGKAINAAKNELEAALASRREELELRAALPSEPTDFSAPGRRRTLGKLHPLTQVTEDIVRSFRKIGFVVADGPEIEDEYHCFDALNTPADHPARDTQDTFYLARSGPNAFPSPGGEGRGEGERQPCFHKKRPGRLDLKIQEGWAVLCPPRACSPARPE
jgi:phenylalanyl-tRNA synthetase alpha chain